MSIFLIVLAPINVLITPESLHNGLLVLLAMCFWLCIGASSTSARKKCSTCTGASKTLLLAPVLQEPVVQASVLKWCQLMFSGRFEKWSLCNISIILQSTYFKGIYSVLSRIRKSSFFLVLFFWAKNAVGALFFGLMQLREEHTHVLRRPHLNLASACGVLSDSCSHIGNSFINVSIHFPSKLFKLWVLPRQISCQSELHA